MSLREGINEMNQKLHDAIHARNERLRRVFGGAQEVLNDVALSLGSMAPRA